MKVIFLSQCSPSYFSSLSSVSPACCSFAQLLSSVSQLDIISAAAMRGLSYMNVMHGQWKNSFFLIMVNSKYVFRNLTPHSVRFWIILLTFSKCLKTHKLFNQTVGISPSNRHLFSAE